MFICWGNSKESSFKWSSFIKLSPSRFAASTQHLPFIAYWRFWTEGNMIVIKDFETKEHCRSIVYSDVWVLSCGGWVEREDWLESRCLDSRGYWEVPARCLDWEQSTFFACGISVVVLKTCTFFRLWQFRGCIENMHFLCRWRFNGCIENIHFSLPVAIQWLYYWKHLFFFARGFLEFRVFVDEQRI